MLESTECVNKNLGDVFLYSIQKELPIMLTGEYDDYEKNGINFFASLCCMKIKSFIDIATVREIVDLIKNVSSEKIDDTIKAIRVIIFKKINEADRFNSFKEIIDFLNGTEIPNVCFRVGFWMINNGTNFYMNDGAIFYILKKEKLFVCLNTIIIDSANDLYIHKYVIGEGYEDIYNYDEKNNLTYLKMANKNHCYATYERKTNTFTICDSESDNCNIRNEERGMIGIIKREKNNTLTFEVSSIMNGSLIGQQIVPCMNYFDCMGMCSYDSYLNVYNVTLKNRVTEGERWLIQNVFNLSDEDVRYSIICQAQKGGIE